MKSWGSLSACERVERIYIDRGWSSDPRSVARGWGVGVSPIEDRNQAYCLTRYHGDPWIYYRVEDDPRDMINVYGALAEYFGGVAAPDLYLPVIVARTAPLAEILLEQPWIEKRVLTARYLEIKGSGTTFRRRTGLTVF